MPNVRIMTTGNENTELAKDFGLPYIILRNSRPYDTTTLNYNLQLWDTDAFSLYTTRTSSIDKKGALIGIESIFKFMANNKLLMESHPSEIESKIVEDKHLISARVSHAGILETYVHPGESVRKGQRFIKNTNIFQKHPLRNNNTNGFLRGCFEIQSHISLKQIQK